MKKTRGYISVGLLLFVIGLVVVTATRLQDNDSKNATNATESSTAENRFRPMVSNLTNINDGLLLTVSPVTFTDSGGLKIMRYIINFKNLTQEVIVFPNSDYGLRVYQYDRANDTWNSIDTLYIHTNQVVTLPPLGENPQSKYYWDLDPKLLIGLDPKENFRVLFTGKGEKSGTEYGAYIDILTNQ